MSKPTLLDLVGVEILFRCVLDNRRRKITTTPHRVQELPGGEQIVSYLGRSLQPSCFSDGVLSPEAKLMIGIVHPDLGIGTYLRGSSS